MVFFQEERDQNRPPNEDFALRSCLAVRDQRETAVPLCVRWFPWCWHPCHCLRAGLGYFIPSWCWIHKHDFVIHLFYFYISSLLYVRMENAAIGSVYSQTIESIL